MNELFKSWAASQIDLKLAKALELKLRKQVLEELPGKIGTKQTDFPEDKVAFKITRGVTRKVDPSVLSKIFDCLSDDEQLCIDYRPTLSAKNYAELEPGSMLSRAIIVTPSLPSIKVIELEEE